MTDFRETLGQYAKFVGFLHSQAEIALRRMTDEEFAAFGEALDGPTQSNCWFAVYDAAKYLRPIYDGERYRRERAAAEATS